MIKNINKANFIKKKRVEIVVLSYLFIMLLTGLLLQTPRELYQGLINIFKAPGVLITDYVVIGGLGPALVNAAGVALIGYLVLILNKVPFRGTSIAAIFTLFGFGLFGKNIWSILPIICGVYIYCKLSKQKMISNVYPALFGTAMAPLVTHAAFSFGWGIGGGIAIGLVIGFLTAPISGHVLRFHEGYNLYNIGFTAGIVGFLLLSILRAFGLDSEIIVVWASDYDVFLRNYSLIIFSSMIILGLVLSKYKLNGLATILKYPGTLISDFTNIGGFGNTLINMGLVGLIGVTYIELVGGNFNGPTLGGLFTMVGFAAFGKHPLNITPIMLGVWLGTKLSLYDTRSPGPMLAALFGTALAPISGQFGPIVGILAGMTHLFIVSKIGVLHGGLNLYNNGFSAGFVAAIFLAILNSFKKDK